MKEFLDKAGLQYFYNKIKPSNSQIQSDWNESDSSSKAYIANKPSVVLRSEMGEANGVATLDQNGHLDTDQLEGNYPNSIAGNVIGEFSDESQVSFRPTAGAVDVNSGKAGKGAKIIGVKGNVVNWNQYIESDFNSYIAEQGTASVVDNVAQLNFSTSRGKYFVFKTPVVGHKYAHFVIAKCDIPTTIGLYTQAAATPWGSSIIYLNIGTSYSIIGTIKTVTSTMIAGSGNAVTRWGLFTDDAIIEDNTFYLAYQGLCDLTLMYGEGNEPPTFAQFQADFQKWFGKTLGKETQNNGELIPVKTTGIKTVGFNQWDEEWEIGTYDENTGQKKPKNDAICSKNYIQVFPNTSYYLCTPTAYGGNTNFPGRIYEYDSDKNYIGSRTNPNRNFTTFDRTRYITFQIASAYGTTYNHDICINLSWSGYRNGEYEEYWTQTKNLPITTLTGKVDGEGESVVVFPDGMKKAGIVYDEIYRDAQGMVHAVKRIGSVDMGTLTYTVGSVTEAFITTVVGSKAPSDSATVANIVCDRTYLVTSTQGFNNGIDKSIGIAGSGSLVVRDSAYDNNAGGLKTSLNGNKLYYELAEPVDYILDDFELPLIYDADDYGTEEVLLGTNGCAPVLSLKYGINAGDTIKNLPHNYVSAMGDQSFTAAQKARARRNIGAVSQGELESANFAKMWSGTQAQYDALSPDYDPNTIYIITATS